MKEVAILNDVRKCTGCRGCQVACKQWNELEGEDTSFFGGPGYQNPPELSPQTWNLIRFFKLGEDDEFHWSFRRQACMHCSDPACVEICPVGAMKISKKGAVIVDEKECLGCPVCRQACPYSIPNIDPETRKSRKCNFCIGRIAAGKEPACVQTCPTSSLVFGPREELLEKAREAAAEDDGLCIYGDKQRGGLHIIYLLPDTCERFDLPPDPEPGTGLVVYQYLLRSLGFGGIGAWFLSGLFKEEEKELQSEERDLSQNHHDRRPNETPDKKGRA